MEENLVRNISPSFGLESLLSLVFFTLARGDPVWLPVELTFPTNKKTTFQASDGRLQR
jgi:hypothetical protein